MTRYFCALCLILLTAQASAQPTVEPSAMLTPPGGQGWTFGASVAVDGTTLVVGEPARDSRGTAYVYEWRRGAWTLVTQLRGAEVLDGDAFGSAVAVSGDTIVVGAPGDDTVRDATGAIVQTTGGKGAAYVFRRSGDSWTQQVRLDRESASTVPATTFWTAGAGDAYGTSVAVDGDVVMVGAPWHDAAFFNTPDTGVVFVYERGSSGWTFADAVMARALGRPVANGRLGTRLAMAEGVAAAAHGGSDLVTLVARAPSGSGFAWHIAGSVPTWFIASLTPQDGFGLTASFGPITTLVPTGTGVLVTETASLRQVSAEGEVTTTGPLPAATMRVFESPTHYATAVGDKQLFLGDLSGGFSFLAGNPTLGLMDGTGTTAGFGTMRAVAPDGLGNYYVADLASIRKVTAAGVVTTVAGLPGVAGADDGPAGVGRLGTAQALVFDPSAQLLYIADRGAIRTMAPDGTLTTIAGVATTAGTADGLGAAARFTAPHSLVLATGGGVWLIDGRAIRHVTAGGAVTTHVGLVDGPSEVADGPASTARFKQPTTMAISADGTRYVADAGLVRRVAPDGSVLTLAGSPPQPVLEASALGARVALTGDYVAAGIPDGRAPLRPVDERVGSVWVSSLVETPAVTQAVSPLPAYPPPGARAFGWGVAFSGDLLFASDQDLPGRPVMALRRNRDQWEAVFQLVPGPAGSNILPSFGSTLAGSARFVAAGAPGPSLASIGVVFVFDIDAVDTDGDSLPDRWETRYGLDPATITGDDGPDGDPDGDGMTNAAELAAHSHPRNLADATRYFAEGARTSFFTTQFAIANPGSDPAEVLLRSADGDGTLASSPVTVPARERRTVQVPLGDAREFATRVESDVPIVVDRVMEWDADQAYGSHGERAQEAASSTWYFAEGATHSGFELFYLLYNPSQAVASVQVRYLRGQGAPLEKTYDIAPGQRFNIWVNLETFNGQPLLADAEVSARISVLNDVPIIAERAMYRTPPGVPTGTTGALFAAGHESAGVTAPAASWFFAEGAANDFFDLFVLIANPGDAPSTVRARFMLGSGQTFTKTYDVPASSRFNIWVDQETFDGIAGTPLANVGEVSVTLDVLSGPLVVAERSMWWPGPTSATWIEAHNSPGATAASPAWVAAAGEVGVGLDTYYLLANPGDTDANVTLTLLWDDGAAEAGRTYTVPARSRFTVHVRSDFPEAVGRRFSALATTAPAVPIVVEWSIYRDALGQQWGAGANALATPWP